MITVVGWPRSGTHWIKSMLEHIMDQEVIHSHPYPDPLKEGMQYIFIIRHPLDAFASHWRVCNYRHLYERTQLEHVGHFLKGSKLREPNWRIGWEPYTRKLIEIAMDYPEQIVMIRQEDLYCYPTDTLGTVTDCLHMSVTEEQINEAVFSTQGVRRDPWEAPADAEMGKRWKWIDELKASTVAAIYSYCGKLIEELWP